jgi:hypothetical protein
LHIIEVGDLAVLRRLRFVRFLANEVRQAIHPNMATAEEANRASTARLPIGRVELRFRVPHVVEEHTVVRLDASGILDTHRDGSADPIAIARIPVDVLPVLPAVGIRLERRKSAKCSRCAPTGCPKWAM